MTDKKFCPILEAAKIIGYSNTIVKDSATIDEFLSDTDTSCNENCKLYYPNDKQCSLNLLDTRKY